MEPRKAELTKNPEQPKDQVQKSRFLIEKLEERIAPNIGGSPNGGVGNKGGGNHCGYASCGHHK